MVHFLLVFLAFLWQASLMNRSSLALDGGLSTLIPVVLCSKLYALWAFRCTGARPAPLCGDERHFCFPARESKWQVHWDLWGTKTFVWDKWDKGTVSWLCGTGSQDVATWRGLMRVWKESTRTCCSKLRADYEDVSVQRYQLNSLYSSCSHSL